MDSLPARPTPPIVLRAEAVRAEVKEAEAIKFKLEQKEGDIKELKLLLRNKGEELSEMKVREPSVLYQ